MNQIAIYFSGSFFKKLFTFIILALCSGATSYRLNAQTVLHVSTDGKDTNSGENDWGNAVASIDRAVERAKEIGGDIDIWVAKGKYSVVGTIPLEGNVSIYGGFEVGGDFKSRDYVNNSVVIEKGGIVTSVTLFTSQKATVLIDGVTLDNQGKTLLFELTDDNDITIQNSVITDVQRVVFGSVGKQSFRCYNSNIIDLASASDIPPFYFFGTSTINEFKLINNTLANWNFMNLSKGLFFTDPAVAEGDILVSNNIFSNISIQGGVVYFQFESDPGSLFIRNNLFSEESNPERGDISEVTNVAIPNDKNIYSGEPDFVSSTDFRLQESSLDAINKGNNDDADITGLDFDLYGNNRYSGANVDIGAFEFQQTASIIPENVCVVPGKGEVTISWDAVDGVTNYVIESSKYGETNYISTGEISGVTHTLMEGSLNESFLTFRVKADNNEVSEEVSAFITSGAGNALENPRVTLSGDNLPYGHEARTIEAWVKIDTDIATGEKRTIFNYGTDATETAFRLLIHNDNNLALITRGTTGTLNTNIHLETGRYYHVAYSFNGVSDDLNTNSKFYIDGTLVPHTQTGGPTKGVMSTFNSSLGASIGQDLVSTDKDQHFLGEIDEVRVWGDERSIEEIQDNMFTPILIGKDNLLGHWHLDEPLGEVAYDASCNGNHGDHNNTLNTNDNRVITLSQAMVPPAPENVCVQTDDMGDVVVTWDPVIGVSNYTVFADNTSASFSASVSGTSSHTVTNTMDQNTLYEFTVQSENGGVSEVEGFTPVVEAGRALDFNGVDQYLEVSYSSELDITGDLSLEAWIYPTDLSSTKRILRTRFGANSRGYGFGIDVNRRLIFVYNGQGGGTITSSITIEENEWQHVAVTVDGTGQIVNFYLNGELLHTSSTGLNLIATQNGNFTIGGENINGSGDFFNGQIDEVRIWDDVRSDIEINESKDTPLLGSEDHLVGLWHFDEPVGTGIAYDATCNGNNGTLINAMVIDSKAMHPFAPQSVCASYDGTDVTLTWEDNITTDLSTTEDFKVYSSEDEGVTWNEIASANLSVSGATATVSTSSIGINYYAVAGVDKNGQVGDLETVKVVISDTEAGISLELDGSEGSTEYIDISSVNDEILGEEMNMSVSMWFKVDENTTTTTHTLFAINGDESALTTGNENKLIIQLRGGNIVVNDNNQNATFDLEQPFTIDDKWHHIAYTRNGSNGTLFVDGMGSSYATSDFVLESSDFWSVGQEYDRRSSSTVYTQSDHFQGEIDEVSIWTKTLSASEIASIRDTPATGSDDGLVGLWHFDEPSGFIAYDASCLGNNGVHVGSPSFVTESKALHPFAPQDFAATVGGSDVTLTWTDITTDVDVADYRIYRGVGQVPDISETSADLITPTPGVSETGGIFSVIDNSPFTGCDSVFYTVIGVDANDQVGEISDTVAVFIGDPLVVTETTDMGTCGELRYAINWANNDPDESTIEFNFASASRVIEIESDLPDIIYPVVIDGWSEPSWVLLAEVDKKPVVEITTSIPEVTHGLVLAVGSENSTVRGLALTGFTGGRSSQANNALSVQANECSIYGNYIGLGIDGMVKPNFIGLEIIGASNNVIGYNSSNAFSANSQRNVITGNESSEINIHFNSFSSNTNFIAGNYIGYMPDGITTGNNINSVGIGLNNASENIFGGSADEERNYIYASGGVLIGGSALNNEFYGNSIGVDVNGTLSNPLSGYAIRIGNDNRGNVIGNNAIENSNILNGKILVGNDGAVTAENTWGINSYEDNILFTQMGGTLQNDIGAPIITEFRISDLTVYGTAENDATIYLYADTDETGGTEYIATITAGADGEWDYPLGQAGIDELLDNDLRFLTATQIAIIGSPASANSSELATHVLIDVCVDPLIVTSTGDDISECGTLRRALVEADLTPATTDTIKFNFTGVQPYTIQLDESLTINSPVVIDGYSQDGSSENMLQDGYDGVVLVEIDGSNLTSGSGLIEVNSDATVVQGLSVINHLRAEFSRGINVNASNVQLRGNWIGVSSDGSSKPNSWGIAVEEASNAIIGGATPGDRNIIANNATVGVRLDGDNTGATVLNNWIGLDLSGGGASNRVGVVLNGKGAVLGGEEIESWNVIAFNEAGVVNGENIDGSTIVGNSIYSNTTMGISYGGFALGNAPLTTVDAPSGFTLDAVGELSGTSTEPLGTVVYVYADSDNQGQIFLGSTSVDPNSEWSIPLDLTNLPMGLDYITATYTRTNLSTSEFSEPLLIDVCANPFLVTKAIDDGLCGSLRFAITEANASLEDVKIEFDENLAGPVIVESTLIIDKAQGTLAIEGEDDLIVQAGAGLASSDIFEINTPVDLSDLNISLNNVSSGISILVGAEGTVIDGLKILNGRMQAVKISVNNITVSNSEFINIRGSGGVAVVQISNNARNVVISNNTFILSPSNGIEVTSGSEATLSQNVITDVDVSIVNDDIQSNTPTILRAAGVSTSKDVAGRISGLTVGQNYTIELFGTVDDKADVFIMSQTFTFVNDLTNWEIEDVDLSSEDYYYITATATINNNTTPLSLPYSLCTDPARIPYNTEVTVDNMGKICVQDGNDIITLNVVEESAFEVIWYGYDPNDPDPLAFPVEFGTGNEIGVNEESTYYAELIDEEGCTDVTDDIEIVKECSNNTPPVAKDTSITVAYIDFNGPFVDGLEPLIYDTDIDGDILSIIAIDGEDEPIIGDFSATEFTYLLPDFDYSFHGIDSVEYVVSDGNGGIDTGSFIVDVVNPSQPFDIDNEIIVSSNTSIDDIYIASSGFTIVWTLEDGTPVPAGTLLDAEGTYIARLNHDSSPFYSTEIVVISINDCEALETGMISVTGTAICSGNVTLSVPNIDGVSYQWSYETKENKIVGATSESYDVLVGGDYILTYSDEVSCEGTFTETVVLGELTPTISTVGNTLTSSTGDTYQWYVEVAGVKRAIVGETSSSYSTIFDGTYSVLVSYSECELFSDEEMVTGSANGSIVRAGLEMTDVEIWIPSSLNIIAAISLYPNPVDGSYFQTTFTSANTENFTITVLTVEGKEIFTKEVERTGYKTDIDLNKSVLTTGAYYIQVVQSGQQYLEKLMIY